MKQDHVIIYDSCCPMCSWYTGIFIKSGLLPEEGRQTFSGVRPDILNLIDPNKSRHEIPLVNLQAGTVQYGVDAIMEIVGSRYPTIIRICKFPLLNWIIRKMYKLISYNRRVIVAAEKKPVGFDSTPDFHVKYRFCFLLIGFIINTIILYPLQLTVFDHSVFAGNSIAQVQAAHLLLVASNIFIATHLNRNDAYEYLGQVNMLALSAMLLSLPLMIANMVFTVPELVNNIVLSVILFLTVKEYFRRMHYAGIVQQHRTIVPVNMFCLVMFLIYISN
jgi:hypothetical protein